MDFTIQFAKFAILLRFLKEWSAIFDQMAQNLAAEFMGFLRFINRASNDLARWFGPYCNHDPTRIAFLASREWDGMGDLERKPFLKSSLDGESSSVNPYIRYLLHSRYTGESSFDPNSGKQLGENWKSLTPEEKKRFSMDPTESGIEYVIQKRDELHRAYDPKKLCLLEFVLKTKPKWPSSSRLWYFRHESQSIGSSEARQNWLSLGAEERAIYDRCAVLDRKRYNFEKNAWVTNILTIDLDADNFTLGDFFIPEIKSRIESLGSFVEMSRDLPALIGLKRPRNPFSLFIEAYRYQIRDERPEFQFGRHLRECSEAWNKLSVEEKNFYKEESKKLKEKRRDLLSSESSVHDARLTVPIDIFSTAKSSFGPCRPSHLYPRTGSPMLIWRKATNYKGTLGACKEKWNLMTDAEKEPYMRKHQQLKEVRDREKSKIDQKHKQIKSLLKEATKLEDLKQKLRLIGCSSKVVKNLYD